MPNYPKEQLLELFKNLPEDIQEASLSDEVSDNIYKACEKQGLNQETSLKVVKLTGYVFFGLLPTDELAGSLTKELNIESSKANPLAREIIKYVFVPLADSIEALYGKKLPLELKQELGKERLKNPENKKVVDNSPKITDKYREPIL